MKLLSTPDVCEVAIIPQRTLAEWVFKGIVTPAEKGKPGRGHSDQFSVMQVVGIGVSVKLRHSERSIVLSAVEKVISGYGSMTEKKLEKLFAEGKTHFATIHGEKVWMEGGPKYDWPDVREIYRNVKKVADSK